MSKILVTGGAGYIGSHTNLALLDKGFETVVFDNLSYGHSEFVPENSTFFKGDLLNKQDLDRVFKENKIEAVIHFAAFIAVGESVEHPDIYYKNNVIGTLNLLDSMRENGVDKIVFSSTAAVYGLPDNNPIKENFPKKPINPYGRTKLIMEEIMDDYYNAFGLNSIRLRYFNACGADTKLRVGEDHTPETHLIPLVILTALGKRESIKVFGTDYDTHDGSCIRDYIHVEDLAKAHILALEKLLSSNGICEAINLGTKQGYTVLEVIQKAKEITGVDFQVDKVSRRAGDPGVLVADNTFAKEFLGFEATSSDIENIIKTAWKWHQKRHLNN